VNSHANRNIFPFAWLAGSFVISLAGAMLLQQYYFVAIPFALLLFYAAWQRVSMVFFLLLASLPFSFEYSFTSSLATDIPDEGLMLLVSLLFLGYALYRPQVLRHAWQHPLLLLLFFHLAWMIVAAISSTHSLLSIKFLLAKGWYIGAFVLAPVIVFRETAALRWAAIVIATSMALLAIIVLWRHAEWGFSFATINDAVSPFFRNHVNYSAMLVCVIPLFIAFYQLNKGVGLRSFLLLMIAILLTALFFSYARGAWLALAAGFVAWWLIKKKAMMMAYVVAIVVVLAGLFWIKSGDRYLRYAHDYKTTIFHSDFKEHLVATYRLKDVSTAERFYRWIAGVRMIKEDWLTGYGPSTFYSNYKPFTVPAYKTWVSDNKEQSTVHNYFLLLAIEQGIPGLFFFLLLVGGMFYYAQRLYHRISDNFYKTVAITTGIITAMIVTVNLLSDLVETDKVGSLFFLCLSVLVMTDLNTRKVKSSEFPG
jgi:O-antigen ligase